MRALAGDLGLAVNTVARVYKELEADGLVVTEGRRGTRVTGRVASADRGPGGRRGTGPRGAAALGLTLAEATRLVEQGWTR